MAVAMAPGGVNINEADAALETGITAERAKVNLELFDGDPANRRSMKFRVNDALDEIETWGDKNLALHATALWSTFTRRIVGEEWLGLVPGPDGNITAVPGRIVGNSDVMMRLMVDRMWKATASEADYEKFLSELLNNLQTLDTEQPAGATGTTGAPSYGISGMKVRPDPGMSNGVVLDGVSRNAHAAHDDRISVDVDALKGVPNKALLWALTEYAYNQIANNPALQQEMEANGVRLSHITFHTGAEGVTHVDVYRLNTARGAGRIISGVVYTLGTDGRINSFKRRPMTGNGSVAQLYSAVLGAPDKERAHGLKITNVQDDTEADTRTTNRRRTATTAAAAPAAAAPAEAHDTQPLPANRRNQAVSGIQRIGRGIRNILPRRANPEEPRNPDNVGL